jgi:hypothetical protein
MRKTFLWYGTYDVQVRKEGYVTKSARTRVWAPWWQVPPIDLLAELVPVKLQDSHAVAYKLQPEAEQQTDPEQVIDRGVRLRRRLRSSKYTRQPVQAPSREEEETR